MNGNCCLALCVALISVICLLFFVVPSSTVYHGNLSDEKIYSSPDGRPYVFRGEGDTGLSVKGKGSPYVYVIVTLGMREYVGQADSEGFYNVPIEVQDGDERINVSLKVAEESEDTELS